MSAERNYVIGRYVGKPERFQIYLIHGGMSLYGNEQDANEQLAYIRRISPTYDWVIRYID